MYLKIITKFKGSAEAKICTRVVALVVRGGCRLQANALAERDEPCGGMHLPGRPGSARER